MGLVCEIIGLWNINTYLSGGEKMLCPYYANLQDKSLRMIRMVKVYPARKLQCIF